MNANLIQGTIAPYSIPFQFTITKGKVGYIINNPNNYNLSEVQAFNTLAEALDALPNLFEPDLKRRADD